LKGIDVSTLVPKRQKDLIILRDWIMSLVGLASMKLRFFYLL